MREVSVRACVRACVRAFVRSCVRGSLHIDVQKLARRPHTIHSRPALICFATPLDFVCEVHAEMVKKEVTHHCLSQADAPRGGKAQGG